jgi:amidase
VGRWQGKGALNTFNGVARFVPFQAVWNHIGQPAATVPVGIGSDGMPLSVQLLGRPNDEATLLSLAAQMEAERPWADRRPPIS